MKIAEVFAVYTGGNIWLFHGKTDDGNYFLTDDNGATLILNDDPARNFDESLFEEWQQKNLVMELFGYERLRFCNDLCNALLIADADHRGGISNREIEAYRKYFKETT